MPEPKISFATPKVESREINEDKLEQLAEAFKEMTDTITRDLKSTGKKFFQIKPDEIEQKLTEENKEALAEIFSLNDQDKKTVFQKAIGLRSYQEDRDYDLKTCDETVKLIEGMPNLDQEAKKKLLFAGSIVAIKNLGTETGLNELDKDGKKVEYDIDRLKISKEKVIPYLLEKSLGEEVGKIFDNKTELGHILDYSNQILAESPNNPSKFYEGATDKKIIVDKEQYDVESITKKEDDTFSLEYKDKDQIAHTVEYTGRVEHKAQNISRDAVFERISGYPDRSPFHGKALKHISEALGKEKEYDKKIKESANNSLAKVLRKLSEIKNEVKGEDLSKDFEKRLELEGIHQEMSLNIKTLRSYNNQDKSMGSSQDPNLNALLELRENQKQERRNNIAELKEMKSLLEDNKSVVDTQKESLEIYENFKEEMKKRVDAFDKSQVTEIVIVPKGKYNGDNVYDFVFKLENDKVYTINAGKDTIRNESGSSYDLSKYDLSNKIEEPLVSQVIGKLRDSSEKYSGLLNKYNDLKVEDKIKKYESKDQKLKNNDMTK
jgi:hypothetical protein